MVKVGKVIQLFCFGIKSSSCIETFPIVFFDGDFGIQGRIDIIPVVYQRNIANLLLFKLKIFYPDIGVNKSLSVKIEESSRPVDYPFY